MTPLIANLGVRPRLSLVVLIAIVPLFALLLAGIVADRRLAIQAASARVLDRATLAAAWQDDEFQSARDVLNVLRHVPQATLADPAQCHVLLQNVAVQYPQFTSVGLVDQSDMISCLNLPHAPMAFRDLDVLRAAKLSAPEDVVVGKFMIGPLSGKPLVVIAGPLPPAGDDMLRPRIAFVSLDLDQAAHHAVSALTPGDSLTLIDTLDPRVLIQVPNAPRSAGRPLRVPPLERAMREQPAGGNVEAQDSDGVGRIFGFAPLDSGSGFMVAVGVPREAVLAAANRRLVIGIGCAVLAALLAAVMAWLFAHITQAGPIRSLVASANKLGAGDLAVPAPLETWQAPEFRALNTTLQQMAVSIEATQATLKKSEQQLRLLADHSTDMIIRVREGGTRLFVSPACLKLTGWDQDEMLGFSSQDTIHPDDVAFVSDPQLFGATPFVFTYRMRHKDGRYIWVEGAACGLPTDAGALRECIIVVRDVGRRVEAERKSKQSEARYRMLEEQGTDMIFQLDHEMVRRYVSPACDEILGYRAEELIGTKPVGMVHPDDADRVAKVFRSLLSGEIERTSVVNRIRHSEGRWVWVEVQLRASSGEEAGARRGIIGSLRDITVRKVAEEQLEAANRRLAALARLDGLTGLANRRTFDEALGSMQARAAGDRTPMSIVLLDVDHFKAFNDLYGHLAGDECLRKVSRAIERVLYHPGDLAVRYGGEEFAALLPNTDEGGASKVAERIREAVQALMIAHAASAFGLLTVSIGVASVLPDSTGSAADVLVSDADRSLYAAKDAGRNAVVCASSLKGARSERRERDAGQRRRSGGRWPHHEHL